MKRLRHEARRKQSKKPERILPPRKMHNGLSWRGDRTTTVNTRSTMVTERCSIIFRQALKTLRNLLCPQTLRDATPQFEAARTVAVECRL